MTLILLAASRRYHDLAELKRTPASQDRTHLTGRCPATGASSETGREPKTDETRTCMTRIERIKAPCNANPDTA
jgi:hypothetical protein